jgi:hypothetical protein
MHSLHDQNEQTNGSHFGRGSGFDCQSPALKWLLGTCEPDHSFANTKLGNKSSIYSEVDALSDRVRYDSRNIKVESVANVVNLWKGLGKFSHEHEHILLNGIKDQSCCDCAQREWKLHARYVTPCYRCTSGTLSLLFVSLRWHCWLAFKPALNR